MLLLVAPGLVCSSLSNANSWCNVVVLLSYTSASVSSSHTHPSTLGLSEEFPDDHNQTIPEK